MLTRTHRFAYLAVLTIAGAIIPACSGSGDPAPPGAAAERSSAAKGGIQPCRLLTSAQVATVLPGHDDGMVTNSGGSFMKGVDDYQCSYTNRETHLLTVVLNVAQNEERFSWIKPSEGTHREHRKIDVGDAGWVYGTANDLKVEAVKGLTVIDLELMGPGAQEKSAAMIELARVIARGALK